jgi:hypothetical protein
VANFTYLYLKNLYCVFMIIEPENAKAREPSLIEDVIPPHAEQFTDASREEVRRRSIGSLYHQYLHSSKEKIITLRKRKALEKQKRMVQPMLQVIEPVKPLSKIRYTFVQPLQTLPSVGPPVADSRAPALFAGAKGFLKNRINDASSFFDLLEKKAGGLAGWLKLQFKRAGGGLSLIWLSIYGLFHSAALKIFPKRYTAASGLVIDWQAKSLSRMKVILPVFAALLILSATTWNGLVNSPGSQDGKTPASGNTAAPAGSAADNKKNSSQASGSGSAAAASAQKVKPLPAGGNASSAGTAPVSSGGGTSGITTGGMGSGGSIISAPTPAPSPPVTIPLPAPSPAPSPAPLPNLPSVPSTHQILDNTIQSLPSTSGL